MLRYLSCREIPCPKNPATVLPKNREKSTPVVLRSGANAPSKPIPLERCFTNFAGLVLRCRKIRETLSLPLFISSNQCRSVVKSSKFGLYHLSVA